MLFVTFDSMNFAGVVYKFLKLGHFETLLEITLCNLFQGKGNFATEKPGVIEDIIWQFSLVVLNLCTYIILTTAYLYSE